MRVRGKFPTTSLLSAASLGLGNFPAFGFFVGGRDFDICLLIFGRGRVAAGNAECRETAQAAIDARLW